MRTIQQLCLVLVPCLVSTAMGADFNGDGFADIAIGAHGEFVAGEDSAGAVHVLFGGPTCFGTSSEQFFTETSFAPLSVPDQFELFGLSVGSGDFDGDGFDDLAMSATNEDVSGFDAAGAVFVIYGAPGGFDFARKQMFTQDTPGIKDKAEPSDFPMFPNLSAETFGRTLVSGDFDADGFDELVIQVGEGLGSKKHPKFFAGAFHVLKGSPTGLVVKGNKLFHQDVKGVPGKSVADGQFGWAMVVADFTADGVDDLAVGAPGQGTPGSVTIFRGVAGKGLSTKKPVRIDEEDAGGTIVGGDSHFFGIALAAGDFRGDGSVQLAIGAPTLDLGADNAGGVYVVALSPSLAITGTQFFSRATVGIDGGLTAQQQFGAQLAAGDFDDDGDDDLVIGCPRDTVGGDADAGSVNVLVGSSSGLTGAGLLIQQDLVAASDGAEGGDMTGDALAVADYDGDGDDDLAVGAGFEAILAVHSAGAVMVFEGVNDVVLDLAQAHWLDRSLLEVTGNPSSNDTFGTAVGP